MLFFLKRFGEGLIPVELYLRMGVGWKGKRIVALGVGYELLDDLVREGDTSVS